METFNRSWALAKESYQVLRRVPSLVAFPILSAIATIAISISFFVPLWIFTGGKDLQKIKPEIGYPLMFAFYFVTYFVVIFFNSAMVACAYQGLQGRETSLGYGMSVAWSRIGAILGWTAIAATVGMIIRTIAERSGLIGNIVVGLVGFVWNVATYFVVPVLVIEQGSPVAAVKKSSMLLKQTWGERLIVAVGVSAAMGLFAALGIAAIMGGMMVGVMANSVPVAVILVCLAIVYLLILSTISAALQGIFQTAVYLYAETGMVPDGFDPSAIQGAFKTKESALSKLRNRF